LIDGKNKKIIFYSSVNLVKDPKLVEIVPLKPFPLRSLFSKRKH